MEGRVACHLCGTLVGIPDYDSHVDECATSQATCPLCFGRFHRSAIEAHAAACGGGSAPGGLGARGGEKRAAAEPRPISKHHATQEARQPPKTRHSHNIGNGRSLSVRHGDITLEDADVIVNPANSELKHGAGVAGALSDAGGDIIQIDSDIYTAENGSVPVGSAVPGSAGSLKCKHLVHTVGPTWSNDMLLQIEAEKLLQNAIVSAMHVAESLGATSVAIPAVSSGIFGVPKPICAKALLRAVLQYWCENFNSSISQVRFTNNDQETFQTFLQLFPVPETSICRTLKHEKVVRVVHGSSSHLFFGTHIKHLCVLECTSAKKQYLHHCQHECFAESLNGLLTAQVTAACQRLGAERNEDAMTPLSSFVLQAPHMVVVTVPTFDMSEDSGTRLRSSVHRGLVQCAMRMPAADPAASEEVCGTITVPALGARSGYPAQVAAQIVFEEVVKFLESNASDGVREVALCEDAFETNFQRLVQKGIDKEGNAIVLASPLLPTASELASPPPPDETPAQRRERERAIAQARLQMELAAQQDIFM